MMACVLLQWQTSWTLSILTSTKNDVSETGICLRTQVKPTLLGPIDIVPISGDDGDIFQSAKRHFELQLGRCIMSKKFVSQISY
jgi:hypothetical protein